jgi:MFS family permease
MTMAGTVVQTGTIRTQIPARLDRLPWSAFHRRVLIGLGTVWILDGLEVTMVGSVASRLTEPDSGINITAGQVGLAGALYVAGACLGALFFGHLADRFGRRKLFMLTLGVYLAATVLTGAAVSPWWFIGARFITGAGIGGEYAAINSAIDELIPARARGRVDLLINGTFWLGSIIGSALSLLFLNRALLPADVGWRLAFVVGIVLGFGILLVRRHVPESPRWLFIHGRQDEAEGIVDGIEREVEEETGVNLEPVDEILTIRQRRTISFAEIARVAVKLYPRRAILGFALFVGQAFIYNGITFNLGTLFTTFYGISSTIVPVFLIIYAVGNLLGPVLLGRLFDTIGRKPMIAGTYLGSAMVTVPLALVFRYSVGGTTLFIILVVITFFLASAGASAAYLTVSEIFPMETRALAIAFFYAVGTAVGGITGPLLFGQLINSHQRSLVMVAFFIGAAVMALGGITEMFFGVKAERASLESIAPPLTVAEAEQCAQDQDEQDQCVARAEDNQAQRQRLSARRCREEAEHARGRAAEYQAEMHELEAVAAREPGVRSRQQVLQTLLRIEELRAAELDAQATASDELASARNQSGTGALARAEAAQLRARAFSEQIAALSADSGEQAERHLANAEAAIERSRARAREQLALVDIEDRPPAPQRVARARERMHRAWAELHEERAALHEARGERDAQRAARHEARAVELEQLGLAAEQRVRAEEHRAAAEDLHDELTAAEHRQAHTAEHGVHTHEREERIRDR